MPGKDGSMDKHCRTSQVVVEKLAGYIETDKCVKACGVDRDAVGISSDAFLEPHFLKNMCTANCYEKCPNLVELYFNLAAGEEQVEEVDGAMPPSPASKQVEEVDDVMSPAPASEQVEEEDGAMAPAPASEQVGEEDGAMAPSPASEQVDEEVDDTMAPGPVSGNQSGKLFVALAYAPLD
uniref:uncharacterized protein LOC105352622 n=1 Tax=Fragaria vesca subsp. vesca TaxID=101020 RepID=UPI0005C9EB92|nr:PREDICTED: uncharacterized protein LOC105352622 [Fragaria vesca subsp. vesca]